MKIDLEHIHYWMNAIRESNNPMRTMDAFWKGQIQSKTWLIDNLSPLVTKPSTVDIHGGWVGVLASLMFQSDKGNLFKYIRSIDIDPLCQHVATMMNKIEEQDGRFTSITQNMIDSDIRADIVINTSCEHITQEQYEQWLDNVPNDAIIVLQSNNYNIPEHVRIAKDIEEFEKQSHLDRKYVGTLRLPMYDRYMIIGKKLV